MTQFVRWILLVNLYLYLISSLDENILLPQLLPKCFLFDVTLQFFKMTTKSTWLCFIVHKVFFTLYFLRPTLLSHVKISSDVWLFFSQVNQELKIENELLNAKNDRLAKEIDTVLLDSSVILEHYENLEQYQVFSIFF